MRRTTQISASETRKSLSGGGLETRQKSNIVQICVSQKTGWGVRRLFLNKLSQTKQVYYDNLRCCVPFIEVKIMFLRYRRPR